MAVVAGVVSRRRGVEVSLDGVERVLDLHGESAGTVRGPGLELTARCWADAGAAMAVRRDQSGSVVLAVVADAVLYGQAALAGVLGAPSDSSPAELVLAGYEHWGDDLADRLSGRFAFAVVDRRPGRPHGVLLSADHQGSRPLSFHVDDERVAFCSLALPLADMAGVGHRLDQERLAELVVLAFGGERSVIDGVVHVMPGTSVRISDGGVTRSKWWRPEEISIDGHGGLDAHAVRLRDVFDEATSDAIAGTRTLGVKLSGGLDSQSVAATVARMRPAERIRTYTSVPPLGWTGSLPNGWDADERHLVEHLAVRYPNLTPTWIESDSSGMLDRFETLWEFGTPPERNTTNYLWIHAIDEEAAADGVDLMLTGVFGNRHFSADGPCWLVDLARHGRFGRLLSEARSWATATGRPTMSVLRSDLISPAVPARLRARRRPPSSRRVDRWLEATAIAEHRRSSLDLPGLLPVLSRNGTCWWTRDTSALFDMSPVGAQSHAVVRSRYRFDTADPTSDRRVIEIALTQPERWRRHRGADRAIVRRAMSDRLPSEIVERRRRGAQLPDWSDRLREIADDLVAEADAAHDHPSTREIIDTARVRELARSLTGDSLNPLGHQFALPRALHISRYVRWFESRSRRE